MTNSTAHGQPAIGNPMYERMRQKYATRISAAAQSSAAPKQGVSRTAADMHKNTRGEAVRRIADPFENRRTANPAHTAPKPSPEVRRAHDTGTYGRAKPDSGIQRPNQRTAQKPQPKAQPYADRCDTASRPAVTASNPTIQRRRINIPSGYTDSCNRASAIRAKAIQDRREKQLEEKESSTKWGIFHGVWEWCSSIKKEKEAEVRVKRRHVPVAAFLIMIVCTVMVTLALIYSAQVAESKSAINELETTKYNLEVEKDKLTSTLEVRDDIHEFEQIATSDIGMVKSDLVQTKFVTVSSAEKIEVIGGDTGDSGMLANVLSAIGSTFGNLW